MLDFGNDRVRLPGERRAGVRTHACVYEVELEGFASHTRRHFAGCQQTHIFFSREAVHAALWDLWAPESPSAPEPQTLPYGGTPLWAPDAAVQQMHYSSPDTTFRSGNEGRKIREQGFLTRGTMEFLPPGTRLRGAVWGEKDQLPPLFEDRGFWIGKGRAPARVVWCRQAEVEIRTERLPALSLPIQVPREAGRHPVLGSVGQKPVADAPGYRVVRLARGSQVPHFVLEDWVVPAIRWDQEAGPVDNKE